MGKIKICIAVGEKPGKFGGIQITHNVSNIDDRKGTIKVLRSIHNGSWWDDIALDQVYENKIAKPDLDNIVRDKDIDSLLMKTDKNKWEKFVRAFVDERDTNFEIKTINI